MKKHLGRQFQKLREEKGLSQIDIAKRVGLDGAQGISNFERIGFNTLAPKKVLKYAKIIGFPIDELFNTLKTEMLETWKRRAK